MDVRLPANIEVSGIIRAVQAAGGFATVLAKGEKDAGTLLVVCIARDAPAKLYERMPQMDGARRFEMTREEDTENKSEFSEYLNRRRSQDSDIWILELDIAQGERFIDFTPT